MLDPEIPYRIQQIYQSCTHEEQYYLRKILEEIADTGDSETYNNIWLADYKEIPVDKHTFLTDPRFLGGTNDCGKSIYPAWMDTMLELERTGNQYYEIVFTGATRTGKTSTAVSDCAYNLYRLMCLKDPQTYFGLKAVTRISVFFFNITTTLARGVAFKEFNDTVANCPWFMDHGHMSKSEAYPTYIPEGGLIEITYGSDASHALGKASYCLVGTTRILTPYGIKQLQDIIGPCTVQQVTPCGDIISVDAYVDVTNYVTDTIRITLEDGTVIEGTPEHQVMLEDGSYKCLGELCESDTLYSRTIL